MQLMACVYNKYNCQENKISFRKPPLLGPPLSLPDQCGIRKIQVRPVSITRFPLGRSSPGAGLLRNPFVHR